MPYCDESDTVVTCAIIKLRIENSLCKIFDSSSTFIFPSIDQHRFLKSRNSLRNLFLLYYAHQMFRNNEGTFNNEMTFRTTPDSSAIEKGYSLLLSFLTTNWVWDALVNLKHDRSTSFRVVDSKQGTTMSRRANRSSLRLYDMTTERVKSIVITTSVICYLKHRNLLDPAQFLPMIKIIKLRVHLRSLTRTRRISFSVCQCRDRFNSNTLHSFLPLPTLTIPRHLSRWLLL